MLISVDTQPKLEGTQDGRSRREIFYNTTVLHLLSKTLKNICVEVHGLQPR